MAPLAPRFLCVLGLGALLGACSPRTLAPSEESSSSSSETSSSAEGESSSDEAAPAPESSSDESTTEVEGELCIEYCEVVDACQEWDEPDCVDDCRNFARFRVDNYDEACQAASAATLACTAALSCEAYEDYGCESEGIAEYEACNAGALPQPGLQAFCTMVAACSDSPYGLCITDVLDYNIRQSYELRCDAEYEALMACIGGLSCEEYADEAMVETLCAAQLAAVDAACPTFGQD